MPRSLKADNPVHTYVDGGTVDALDEIAEAEGRSRAAVVRRAILADLTRRSRAAQGLADQVTDAEVLARVARLLEEASRG